MVVYCCGGMKVGSYCSDCGELLQKGHSSNELSHDKFLAELRARHLHPDDYMGDESIDSQDWDRNAYYVDGRRYIEDSGPGYSHTMGQDCGSGV